LKFISEKPLTTGEIAKYCHVTPVAVLKWIKAGRIKAYSTPGGHFRVLPEDFKGFLEEYVMPVPKNFQDSGELHILVADDDESMVKIISKAFKRSEHPVHVYTARNGYEACVKMGCFPISVAIVDIMMDNMDGLEFCKIIKEMDGMEHVKFVIISGYINETNKKRLFELGIDNFIEKPFKMDKLVSTVLDLVGSEKVR